LTAIAATGRASRSSAAREQATILSRGRPRVGCRAGRVTSAPTATTPRSPP